MDDSTDAGLGVAPSRRVTLLARLAAERAFLLQQFEGLDEDVLSRSPLADGGTAASLLAHLGYWDAYYTDRLSKVIDGRLLEIRSLSDSEVDERNGIIQTRAVQMSFPEALAVSRKERRNFLMVLGRTPDAVLRRRLRLNPDWRTTPQKWVRRRYLHDAEHSAGLARWRQNFPPNDASLRTIHRSLLRPILGLARQELQAIAALVAPRERQTRPVDGSWTLKSLLGHLVDYERLGVVALKAISDGQKPDYGVVIETFDAFNRSRMDEWSAVGWEEVWTDYLATRKALLLLADSLSDRQLIQPFVAPWRATTTACGYLLDMAQHEQEHAGDLRHAFSLPTLPRRLRRAV